MGGGRSLRGGVGAAEMKGRISRLEKNCYSCTKADWAYFVVYMPYAQGQSDGLAASCCFSELSTYCRSTHTDRVHSALNVDDLFNIVASFEYRDEGVAEDR